MPFTHSNIGYCLYMKYIISDVIDFNEQGLLVDVLLTYLTYKPIFSFINK